MKKVFTLLTLLVAVCTGAWASTVADLTSITSATTITMNGLNGTSGLTDGALYSSNRLLCLGGCGYSDSKGSTEYAETSYPNCYQIKNSRQIALKIAFNAKITIVGNSHGERKWRLGTSSAGKEIAESAVSTTTLSGNVDGSSTAKVVYINATGDLYLGAIIIEAAMTKLSTPTITYVAATGAVTIGAVANATKVTYTTDGTEPTASSTTYSASFNVEDGTVVKAIAIGNGTTYSNSNVASETVLFTGIKIATSVINKFNGYVAITCATPNATIKYSTNGGDTYNTYSRPFTLTADATVLAHAERTGCTNSDDASEDVTVPATNKTKTIYLDFDDFTISTYTATGKTATDANGYTLTIGNTAKSWSSNNITIKTRGGTKREFKLSNGAQNTLTIPAGVHVTKLTLYSIIHSGKNSTPNGWKEVGGVDYQAGANDYKNVPMVAYNDEADYNNNPDVRVYDIDQTGGTITFTNAGNQLSFVLALDILETTTTITPAKEYVTYVAPANLDFTGLELKAYVATTATSGTVTMEPVTKVPAGTPLVLKKASAASYDVPVADYASAPSTNLLKVSNGVGAIGGDGVYDYILSDGKFYHASAGVLPEGKAYLHLDSDPAGARELSLSFEDEEVTGIRSVDNGKVTIDNAVYDLSGRRVANPTKGLYIVNGKKVILK